MQRFFYGCWPYVLCVWLFCGHLCHAQSTDSLRSVYNLAEVEVVDAFVDARALSGAPLQRIDKGDIERLGLQNVADAVKKMAGVQVHDYGGVGGLKTVSIRGLGAKHTAVTYDGVAVSDAQSGQVDVGRFLLDNVDVLSLEVGQGNDIFRSAKAFSSGGVIGLVTCKPRENRTSLKVVAGDFGSAGVALLRERVFNNVWSYSASVDVRRVEGDYPFELENGRLTEKRRRENGDVKSVVAEGNLFGNFGQGGNLAVKLYYFNSERGLPGAVNFYNSEKAERLWDDNFFAQASYKLFFADKWHFYSHLKYNYSHSRYRDENKNYVQGFSEDRNTQHEYYASVGLGVDACRGLSFALSSDVTSSSLSNNFKNGKAPHRLNSQTVLAARYENKVLVATASLLGTFIDDDVKGGGVAAEDKQRLSPSISLSWRPIASLPVFLRASCRDAYRVPTFADLYYQRMGNTGLKPERATQYNAGIFYSGQIKEGATLSLSVDGYYNSVKDKIVAVPTMYVWSMKNYGKVQVEGVDVTASLQLSLQKGMSLLWDASYSYTHAIDKTKRTSKNYGHQIPYTPRHSGNSSLTFNNRWVNVSYMLTAVGTRYMLPQNIAKNEIASYVEHSLSASREWALGAWGVLRLQGEVQNFTNENYDVIRYYPMPGRQWRLTAKLTF